MSQYTTGEIAKLTGITVRTVQYYDSRGILMPSDFSEGGRRLYNLGDIAYQMKSKKQLRAIMLAVGIPLEIIETGTFVLGLLEGIWWPYLIGLVLVIMGSIFILWYYDRMISFICPECHKVFKPSFKEWSFAKHTATTRKLRCPGCGNHGFCVETYQSQEEKKDE